MGLAHPSTSCRTRPTTTRLSFQVVAIAQSLPEWRAQSGHAVERANYFLKGFMFELHHGDCLATLKTFADNSVDSIVTDPPYGLSFMGKRWDYDVPSTEVWAECLRVLKPGGHLLAFAGTRTQHRMAVRIEDAGFEIRDMIAWVYGSGFPKSLDVSKAIDKAAGAEREVVGVARGAGMSASVPAVGTFRDDAWVPKGPDLPITAPATESARQWQGWGTALKPALEPITVARKPLVGTVAENVLAHGTGAINVDGCRVAHDGESLNGGRVSTKAEGWDRPWKHDADAVAAAHERGAENVARAETLGRWPANLIHDGSEEVLAGFPVTTSGVKVGGQYARSAGVHDGGQRADGTACYGDTGSAARFFYCAKASKSDRDAGLQPGAVAQRQGNRPGSPDDTGKFPDHDHRERTGNFHPTVKPTDLMAYLCRLVTPPGGVVLDPFMGSGSTGKAAMREGFKFIGCELSPEYMEIARARIAHALWGDLA